MSRRLEATVSDELYEALQEKARRDERSLAATVRVILEERVTVPASAENLLESREPRAREWKEDEPFSPLGESLAAIERGANAGVSAPEPQAEPPTDVERSRAVLGYSGEPPTEPEQVRRPPASGLPPLAPNCRDEKMHWRLQPGGMCKWCQGYAP